MEHEPDSPSLALPYMNIASYYTNFSINYE